MAQGMLKDTQIRLMFETGLDENGEPVVKAKTFNNIKKEATVDQIYQAAQAIAGLSAYPLVAVERNDSFDIIA
jgi:hypothetical protein